MLSIYIDEDKIDCNKLIRDVDTDLGMTEFDYRDDLSSVVKDIDGGELINGKYFIDRFGYKMSISELSTGCKGIMLSILKPDKIINLKEAGLNARDYAINNLSKGSILIYFPDTTIVMSREVVDCGLPELGYRLNSIDRLNKYFQDEIYYTPDLSIDGIGRME